MALSEQHQKFIELLFENDGNVSKAADEAGFAKQYGYVLVKTLRKEIIEVAESILALHAPKAAMTLVNGIDTDMPIPTNPQRIDCAKQILDRVGVVKKDQLQLDVGEKVGIFILPAKRNDSSE